MSSEKSLTPQIRFKGFTEAWEQRKLDELGVIQTGNTPSTFNNKNYTEDGLPWISPSDIDEYGKYLPKRFISEYGLKVARTTPSGSILCTCIASIGKNTLVDSLCAFNQQINALYPNSKLYDSYFLFTESSNWSYSMQSFAASGTMQIVNKTEFSSIITCVPNLIEQNKISNLFKNLDSLITLHQRKLDALKKIKSALLEKMFPKDGSNIPEIRFTGFTEAWEQCKAINLFKDVSEKGFDNLPVLSATQDRGMVYRDENGINISHDKKNELTYKHVIPGQFVIHLRSFQGGFAHSAIEGITSPAYTVFKFSNESQHDDIFWKYIFMSERFIKSLETVTYGIRDGRSISYSEFLGLPFAVPEKEEESRIGHFLKKYDSLITLHQRKLDALKKIKSALLEKMFV